MMIELFALFATIFAGALSTSVFSRTDDQGDAGTDDSDDVHQNLEFQAQESSLTGILVGGSTQTIAAESAGFGNNIIWPEVAIPKTEVPELEIGWPLLIEPAPDFGGCSRLPGDIADESVPNEAGQDDSDPILGGVDGNGPLVVHFDSLSQFYNSLDQLTPSERAYWAKHFNVPDPGERRDIENLLYEAGQDDGDATAGCAISDILFGNVYSFYAALDWLTPCERAYWAEQFNVPDPGDRRDIENLPHSDVNFMPIDEPLDNGAEPEVVADIPQDPIDPPLVENTRFDWSVENREIALSYYYEDGEISVGRVADEILRPFEYERDILIHKFLNNQHLAENDQFAVDDAIRYGIAIPTFDGQPYQLAHYDDPIAHLQMRDIDLPDAAAYYVRATHPDPELRLTYHERIGWAIHFGVPMVSNNVQFTDEAIAKFIANAKSLDVEPEVVYHFEDSVAPDVVYCVGLVEPEVVYHFEDSVAPDVIYCVGLEAPLEFIFPELQGQFGATGIA